MANPVTISYPKPAPKTVPPALFAALGTVQNRAKLVATLGGGDGKGKVGTVHLKHKATIENGKLVYKWSAKVSGLTPNQKGYTLTVQPDGSAADKQMVTFDAGPAPAAIALHLRTSYPPPGTKATPDPICPYNFLAVNVLAPVDDYIVSAQMTPMMLDSTGTYLVPQGPPQMAPFVSSPDDDGTWYAEFDALASPTNGQWYQFDATGNSSSDPNPFYSIPWLIVDNTQC